MLGRLFEQGNEPFDLGHGVFVGLGGVRALFENGIYEDSKGLVDAVENEQFIGDEKVHHGRLQIIVGRARHDGFDVVNEFVADEADRAAGETRQRWQRDRAVFFHEALDDFEAVADGLQRGGRGFVRRRLDGHGELLDHAVGFHHRVRDRGRVGFSLGPGRRRRMGDQEFLDDFAVLDQLQLAADLADDGAGIAAHKRIAPEMFAAFHRLEQERFALAANFVIGGERGFEIGEQPARHRDDVALLGELQERIQCW